VTFSASELEELAPPLWLGAWRNRPDAQERAAREVSRLGWLYVSRLTQDRRPEELVDLLARLSSRDLTYLRNLRFLASKEVSELLKIGPSLLRKLPQSTRQTRVLAREARGRIDWPGTMRERLSRGGDSTILQVTRGDRHTDVAENRVLAYILLAIARAGEALQRRSDVAVLGLEAARLLGNSALSGVPRASVLTGADRQALRLSRLPEFREEVSAVLALHDGLFADDITQLRHFLGERIWLPAEPDKLFELWALFALVESLEAEDWLISDLRLIGGEAGSAPAFRLRRGEATLSVAYQAIPQAFLRGSRYRELLSLYDISGSARRPDILVTAHGPLGDRHMFVEVKLTDNRDYIVESIYKALGYLSDFEASLINSPSPQGVLVVWSGVSDQKFHTEHPVAIITAGTIRDGGLVPLVEQLSVASFRPGEETGAVIQQEA